MSNYRTNTYADGFGVWHCEVETTDAVSSRQSLALATAEIEQAIKERNEKDILTGVTQLRVVSRDGVLTYYYREDIPR